MAFKRTKFLQQQAQPASAPVGAAFAAPEPATPARERWRLHLQAERAALERCSKLATLMSQADQAGADVADANRALECIADLERQRWLDFVQAGARGEAPPALVAERAQGIDALAHATNRFETDKRQAEFTQPLYDAAAAELADLIRQRPRLFDECLMEAVEEIAELHRAAAERAACLRAILDAIHNCAGVRAQQGQNGLDVVTFVAMATGGGNTPQARAAWMEGVKHACAIASAKGRALVEALQGDASAAIALDDIAEPATSEGKAAA